MQHAEGLSPSLPIVLAPALNSGDSGSHREERINPFARRSCKPCPLLCHAFGFLAVPALRLKQLCSTPCVGFECGTRQQSRSWAYHLGCSVPFPSPNTESCIILLFPQLQVVHLTVSGSEKSNSTRYYYRPCSMRLSFSR